jgi:hypothetical protein
MRWELNALVIESIVLGGVAMGAVVAAGRRFAPAMPAAVWFAIGVLVVGAVVWPAIRVLAR